LVINIESIHDARSEKHQAFQLLKILINFLETQRCS